MDVNDRALRNIELETNKGAAIRKEKFNITAASEIMAIMALSKNLDDLKVRIEKAIIGYNSQDMPIYVKDINCSGSVIGST